MEKKLRVKAAIIDDELHCIKTLRHQIETHLKDIDIVFVSTDAEETIELVAAHKPDLIFLDIEMPRMTGLQLMEKFEHRQFKVIFTTAYDTYAIKAIRLKALDYLLKPIDTNELKDAYEKFLEEQKKTQKQSVVISDLLSEPIIKNTIALSSSQGLFFVKLKDIMYLEGDDCYTHVVLDDGKKMLVSKTLATFESILEGDTSFFRAQKSFIINLQYIKQYIRGEGGEIIMTDNKSVALSRNKKDIFLRLFTKV